MRPNTPYFKTDTPDGHNCHCYFNNVGARQQNDNCVTLKIAITLSARRTIGPIMSRRRGPLPFQQTGQLTPPAPPAGPERCDTDGVPRLLLPRPGFFPSFFLAQCSARAVLSSSGYSEEESSGKPLLLFPPGCWYLITNEKEFVALSFDRFTHSVRQNLAQNPFLFFSHFFDQGQVFTTFLAASHCRLARTPSLDVHYNSVFGPLFTASS